MSAPHWKGLFEWSLKYNDGTTTPRNFSSMEVDPEKMKWLDEVLKNYMKDFEKRMKEIKSNVENENINLKEKEYLLDELMEIVESIDQSKNLHLIGGLSTLIELLNSHFESLRWRAAEIISICVQNNISVQKWFYDGGVMEPLLSLIHDHNSLVKSKAWLALSSMIRNFKEAEIYFMIHNNNSGMLLLNSALNCSDIKIQKRIIFLLEYLFIQNNEYIISAINLGMIKNIILLATNEDIDLREKAFDCLTIIMNTSHGKLLLQKMKEVSIFVNEIKDDLKNISDENKEHYQKQIEFINIISSKNETSSTKFNDEEITNLN